MARYDAKTSRKGQTTIPAEVRQLIGLEPGGTVQYVTTAAGDVRVIAKRKGLQDIKGLFAHGGLPIDIEQAILDSVAARAHPNRTERDP